MNPANSDRRPLLIVTMGVAGSGKSTMAQALASQYGLTSLDADDFHSDDARAHMAAGKPLNDHMRAPWIQSICEHLQQLAKARKHTVLAFSGLKKSYREPLRNCGFDVIFILLHGDKHTILQRMQARVDHFMPTTLLESQFATLEWPTEEDDVFVLDVAQPLPEIVAQAKTIVAERKPAFAVA